MKAHFYSISKDYKQKYISDLKIEGSKYIFNDTKDTKTIFDIINTSNISIKRSGDTKMDMVCSLLKTTKGTYENELISFNFEVYTKNIEISDDKISIEYDLYIDAELNNQYKIYLLIK